MNAFKNLILFIVVSVIGFVIFSWYSGVFDRARVEVKFVGLFVAANLDNIGEYSETRRIQDSLYNLSWEDDIENYKTSGLYFDSPKKTDVKKFNSQVGCIIEKADIQKAEILWIKHHNLIIDRQQFVKFTFRNTVTKYACIIRATHYLINMPMKTDTNRKPSSKYLIFQTGLVL
jgi:hypothetical protein